MATAKKPATKAARGAVGKAEPAKAAKKAGATRAATTAAKGAAKKPPAKAAAKKSPSTSPAKAPTKTAAKAGGSATKTTTAAKPASKTTATRATSTTTKEPPHVTPESTAKKPAAKKPAFDAKFLEAQRVLLLEERATYVRQAESLQAEADSLAELREPGDVQFDEESGEGDTLAVERERDLALSARARQEVEEIDRALAKFDEGTYGICEVSGEPIPKARLQAIPQARERVEYKVGGFGRR